MLLQLSAFLLLSIFQNWQEFKSYEGQFKIKVPGEMQEKSQTIYTDLGAIQYVTFVYQDSRKEADNFLYMVSYCDYPEGSIHSDSTQLLPDFFENTLESAKQSIFGEVMYVDKANYRAYPGRVWRIDYRQGTATLKSKVFLVNNRFYNIQIATTKERVLNNAADKFFDSFGLLIE